MSFWRNSSFISNYHIYYCIVVANVDKKNGEPDRTLPGPIGMCPFSANKDQKLNKGEPDGKLPKPMCAFSALGAMMGGGALPTMPIPKKPSESVYEHIPAKIKRAEKEQLQKEIESEMTEEDKAREREVGNCYS